MRISALVVVLWLSTAAASGRTVIDMPAPRAGRAEVGAVALHRYGHARIYPAYTYISPPLGWPYGYYGYGYYGYGYGYGYGWGWPAWPWGWRWGWGWGWSYGFRYPCWGVRLGIR